MRNTFTILNLKFSINVFFFFFKFITPLNFYRFKKKVVITKIFKKFLFNTIKALTKESLSF